MTSTRRSLAVVLLTTLLIAGCSGDQGVDAASSTTGSTPTTPTSSQPDSSAGGSGSTTSETLGDETTTTTRDPGAGGAVDLDYLVLGPGTRFVPLDDPVMIPASQATWLAPDSIVLGVVHPSGEVQAFAADMMAYHHIANTTIAGEPYLVTY